MHRASALRVASLSFHALGDPAEWGPRHARAATFFAPRAIETIEVGAPQTAFMKFGDTIRIEMLGSDGHSVFGAIEQRVVNHAR